LIGRFLDPSIGKRLSTVCLIEQANRSLKNLESFRMIAHLAPVDSTARVS